MGNSSSHTHEPLDKGFTRGTYGDVKNTVCTFSFYFKHLFNRDFELFLITIKVVDVIVAVF